MGYWLKLYTDILDDPKYFKLSDNAKLGMYEVFLVAKKIETDETTGDLPTIEDIAFHTRRTVEWWNDVMVELVKIIVVEIVEDKQKVRKFVERQAKIPAAERVKQYRKRNNDKTFVNSNDIVTIRNGEKSREEVEVEKNKIRVDVEVDGGDNNPTNLITTFEQHSNLNAGSNADELASDLSSKGVIEADIIDGIHFLENNPNYKLLNFKSICGSAIIAMKNRLNGSDLENPRRYIEGEYGEVGVR